MGSSSIEMDNESSSDDAGPFPPAHPSDSVDNFDSLRPLLWSREDMDFAAGQKNRFYWCYVQGRRKDAALVEGLLKQYHFYSESEYDAARPQIIALCQAVGARAYIRPNVREAERSALASVKLAAAYLFDREYRAVGHVYNKAVGQHHGEARGAARWVVDMDEPLPSLECRAQMYAHLGQAGSRVLQVVPTPHGEHWIVTPFRLDQWPYKEAAVFRDSPTVLYCPALHGAPQRRPSTETSTDARTVTNLTPTMNME